jgi:DNA-binding transcriptional LysR family regulator
MELRHLRYFVAVAEAENVTRAAAKLRIAQPAVSRQVQDLEEELGVSLLERGAKSIRLTDAGRVFLEGARAVLQRADEAVASARARRGGSEGELRVGYAPSLTAQMLPRALRRFHAELPRVRVSLHDLSSQEMVAGVAEGTLDVALRVPPVGDFPGMAFEELARFAICIAVTPSHPFATRRSVPLSKAAEEPLIAYSRVDYPEYHEGLIASFTTVGRAPQIAEEHDSVTSLIAAVEAGRGIAFVASSLECLAGPRLKLVPLTPTQPPVVVGAVYRTVAPSAVVQKFISAAKQEEGITSDGFHRAAK